ncbi:serine hydrolase domain-containing protein [Balneola sp. MJW-20]|uniref:serine hydrolase domain-containing protein n=1 Tax=Gracilimonas aurantiaca TaxID=3234185 RepID=UPI003466332A
MPTKRTFILLLFVLISFLAGPLYGQQSPGSIIQQAEDIRTLRTLIVQKKGQILLKETFRGGGSDQPYNLKSASKSIISLLTGIAVDKGFIDSVETPISVYFEDYFRENPDPRKEAITVKDLLTMRTGLETTSFYNYGRWVISDNWVEFQLNQPFEDVPGGDMVYSTGTTHLLSVIISKASGMSTREFANRFMFGPMNITVGGWDKDPQGYYMGGNNLALSPNDLLKIGQMLLNGGIWEGERILSTNWLQQSFQIYTRSNFNPYDYGYLWWIIDRQNTPVIFAWGFGGQYLFMLPEYDAVVVITNSLANATQRRSYKEPIFELLEDEIIPFLTNE